MNSNGENTKNLPRLKGIFNTIETTAIEESILKGLNAIDKHDYSKIIDAIIADINSKYHAPELEYYLLAWKTKISEGGAMVFLEFLNDLRKKGLIRNMAFFTSKGLNTILKALINNPTR